MESFMSSAICAEGRMMINPEDTQTVHVGKYVSSFGPEFFLEFILNMARVQYNHRMIMEPIERFGGTKQKIRILGSYEEWLVYFARFK
jgi:hypothetical protein